MLLLTTNTSVVSIVSSTSVVVDVHASWVDENASNVVTPGDLNTQIASSAPTTVVPSPSLTENRNVKFLSVLNTDPTNPTVITVTHFDGATTSTIFACSLPAGYLLTYNDGPGWQLYNASGIGGTYVSDGLHGPVAVKPANTSSATGDAALVVAPSPNSPLPVGSNIIGKVTLDPQLTQLLNGGTNTFTTGTYTTVIPIIGRQLVWVWINIKNAPTGTTPLIAVELQEVDPFDTTSVINAITTGFTIGPYNSVSNNGGYLDSASGAVKLTVTVTGSSASFTGCDIWLNCKESLISYGQNFFGSSIAISAVSIDQFSNTYVTKADGSKLTYSSTMAVTPVASATDIATLIGSSSATVRVTRVTVTGTQTTAGAAKVALIFRSAVDTGGTSTAGAAVTHNTSNSGASATLKNYTVNPTGTGTAVGTVREDFIFFPAPATAVDARGADWEFGDRPGGQAIVLQGTAQELAVNLAGVTMTGGSLFVTFEWTEETGEPP